MKKRILAGILTAALTAGLGTTAFAEDTESEKVLNWFASGEVTTMDSGKEYDTISAEQIGYFNDTLYRINSENEAVPSLALDYPTISEDGLTATVEIRQDAKFSNGEAIKAQDIVYAAQRVVDPSTGSQAAGNLSWIANAVEITAGELDVTELGMKALSDYELEIILVAPTPYLNNELSSVLLAPVSQEFVESVGAENYGLSADTLLSSGPFILENWEGADISWNYVKNENFWDAENIYFDQINIEVIKDVATGVSLYEAGAIDGLEISGDYINLYRDTDDYLQVDTLRMTNLELGISSNEYLQNENLRKAISLAINREELAGIILNGSGTPAVGVVPNGIAVNPETGASIEEDFGNLIVYDTELAREYWQKAQEELGVTEITLELYTSDTDEHIKIGTYLQSVLQTALSGLTIDVKNVTASVRFDVMMSYDFDLALGGWTGDYDPTSYVKQFETSYEHNHAQWKSEELTALVNALEAEDGNDFSLRWQHLKEANEYLVDNTVVVNLLQAAKNFLVNPKLKGYETHVLDTALDITRAYFEE